MSSIAQLPARILRRRQSGRSMTRAAVVPELNLIPPELAGRRVSRAEARLAILALVLSVLAFSQLQLYGERTLAGIRGLLPGWAQQADPRGAQAAELHKQINRLTALVDQSGRSLAEATRATIPWGDLLLQLHLTVPTDVALESIRQSGRNEISLAGSGATLEGVFVYQESLKTITSIEAVEVSNVSRSSQGRYSYTFRVVILPGEPVEKR